MNGLDKDYEPKMQGATNYRPMKNIPLSPQDEARNWASKFDGQSINIALSSWERGYYFGKTEVMDKWAEYVAIQPPQPIKFESNEISLATYKMFITQKIKRDSKGNLWAKIKMWYQFLIA